MAKKYNNNKGFLIIEMTPKEAVYNCNFGLVCDNCNNSLVNEDNVYYFAGINRLICKECCDDLIDNLNNDEEDKSYEKRHYNYYAEKLNLEKV